MVVIDEVTDEEVDKDQSSATATKGDKAAELIARISATDDFYQVLDVSRDADDDTIKKAYRKAALRLHPDKCQLDGSKEAFQKLSAAFGCLSDADDRAYYDRTGRERNAGAVGHGHADPEDIFRQFFGEDFDMASAGAGGVRFHSFGGGMGQGGFVFNVGGMGGPGGAAGAGNGGMAQSFLPWPLGDVLSVVPPQLLIIGLVWLFFWGAAWFMTYFVYFMPVLWFAPSKLKLPMCILIWAGIVFDLESYLD